MQGLEASGSSGIGIWDLRLELGVWGLAVKVSDCTMCRSKLWGLAFEGSLGLGSYRAKTEITKPALCRFYLVSAEGVEHSIQPGPQVELNFLFR